MPVLSFLGDAELIKLSLIFHHDALSWERDCRAGLNKTFKNDHVKAWGLLWRHMESTLEADKST